MARESHTRDPQELEPALSEPPSPLLPHSAERTSLHISQLHQSDLMNILPKGSADFRQPQEL
jgi:hypothetical protein